MTPLEGVGRLKPLIFINNKFCVLLTTTTHAGTWRKPDLIDFYDAFGGWEKIIHVH